MFDCNDSAVFDCTNAEPLQMARPQTYAASSCSLTSSQLALPNMKIIHQQKCFRET